MNLESIIERYSNDLIKLNIMNNLLKTHDVFFKISMNINYDFTEYDKFLPKNYYFLDGWSFEKICSKIFKADIKEIFFLNENIINSKEYLLYSDKYYQEYSYDPSSIEELLTFIQNKVVEGVTDTVIDFLGNDIIENYNLAKSAEFSIKAIDVFGIDNNEQKVNYHGSFHGDSLGIYHSDNFYCQLQLVGSNSDLPFHKELLLEAYSLILEKNYKLAFFTAFTALENFCNVKSNTELESNSLSDKFKKAFIKASPCLVGEEAYRQLKTNLSDLILIRNQIAHGNENGNWHQHSAESNAIKMYIFTSMAFLCHEMKIRNFKQFIKLTSD